MKQNPLAELSDRIYADYELEQFKKIDIPNLKEIPDINGNINSSRRF
jgi:hypothetical protein